MNTVKFNKYNTKMVAHRGVSKLECENTVPAFVAAGNRSYYGIETDVHITEDGKFILHHDDTAYRLTGIENLNIEQSEYDYLRSVPLISPIEGDEARKDLRMPALEEYISVCRKYEKFAVLELKNPMPDAAIEALLVLAILIVQLYDRLTLECRASLDARSCKSAYDVVLLGA